MTRRKKSATVKHLRLAEFDSIVTAWAENACGPGWSNSLVWVLVRDGNGKLRVEALQPDEQTADIVHAFAYSALATGKLTAAVKRACGE